MRKPTLYHHPHSFSSQIVKLGLVEKGVTWRSRFVDIGRGARHLSPKYLRLNAGGVVPTLVHKGMALNECVTICLYANNNFPGPFLVPQDDRSRELMERWIDVQQKFPERDLAYDMLAPKAARTVTRALERRKPKIRKLSAKHDDLNEVYKAKLAEIEDWQAILGNAEALEKNQDLLGQVLDLLEQGVQRDTWLAGPDYSLADVVWTAFLARLESLGLKRLWKNSPRPHVAAYYKKAKQRPSFKKAKLGSGALRLDVPYRSRKPLLIGIALLAVSLTTALFFALNVSG